MKARNERQTIAILLAALMTVSVVAPSIASGAEVRRGGPDSTFDPGVGGANQVVVSEEKPVVFRGEDGVEFVDANSRELTAATLVGVSGNAEGIPLESPIPRDQELGQYAVDGRAQNAGVTVQSPRVTDLEVFNERGSDVEGATVPEDEMLLVRAEWNYQNAEDLSLEVTDANGNDVTGDVLTDVESLSDAQRNELTGAYAENPERVFPPGQRGSGTRIEYLQGIGQFETEELEGTRVDAAFWALDLSDQDAGDYTITVEGWDNLDFDAATRSTVVSLTTDRTVTLDTDDDEATRGQNVPYTIRGSSAGATHYVTIEDNDFRNNQVDERVFRDVDDVSERGTVDANDDGEADFAYALVTIDENTGLAIGQLDTAYLDDTNVDINLYEADRELEEVTDGFSDTEDDRTLDVLEGELELAEPAGIYIAGAEVDLRGSAALGVDDVAIYVRDQGDWELVDVNEDGEFDAGDLISVDADGEWEERDVRLSQANDIMSIPGRYRLGVVEAVDAFEDGEIREMLTTSEFSSATSEQTSIIVTEPTLGEGNSSRVLAYGVGTLPGVQDRQENETEEDEPWAFRTYNNEVAVEDGTVEVLGTAPGLDEVLVVMIDTRGRVVTEIISVDNNDVFEEDDVELVTQDGRQLNEGEIEAMVIGPGRDTVIGDGAVPSQDRGGLADLENWVQSFGTGLTQQQVTDRILDETVEEAGSDDLVLQQAFRYADARTSVVSIGPEDTASESDEASFQRQLQPVEVGDSMVVQGVTNRRADDNTITVEVIGGPSAADFDSAATDEWDRTGQWSVNLSTDGIEPGTYTLEVDDGDNTDVVQFEVVGEGEGQDQQAQTETEATNETSPAANQSEAATETTTADNQSEAANETTTADNQSEATNETTTATEQPRQDVQTLEIRSDGEALRYSISFAETVEPVGDRTEATDEVRDGTLTGQVGGDDDSDAYEFGGPVTDISAEGDLSNATFLLDGEEVPPGQLPDVTANDSSMVAPPAIEASA